MELRRQFGARQVLDLLLATIGLDQHRDVVTLVAFDRPTVSKQVGKLVELEVG